MRKFSYFFNVTSTTSNVSQMTLDMLQFRPLFNQWENILKKYCMINTTRATCASMVYGLVHLIYIMITWFSVMLNNRRTFPLHRTRQWLSIKRNWNATSNTELNK